MKAPAGHIGSMQGLRLVTWGSNDSRFHHERIQPRRLGVWKVQFIGCYRWVDGEIRGRSQTERAPTRIGHQSIFDIKEDCEMLLGRGHVPHGHSRITIDGYDAVPLARGAGNTSFFKITC